MTKQTTKADDLFNLQTLIMKAEGELTDLFETFPPPFDWSDYSYDYYDGSLEIYGVPEIFELCEESLSKLKEFGFRIIWLHTVDSKKLYTNQTPRHEQGERYYSLRSG